MSSHPPELRGRTLQVVLACSMCQTALGYGYVLAGPLSPYLLEEFGWSRALLASAQAPQIWAVGLSSALVGYLAIRVRIRSLLSLGAVILAAGFMLSATLESWWQFALLWMVQGLATGMLGDITVGAVVAQWTQRSRAVALGIAYAGSNLGGAVATRFFAAIAATAGWRTGLMALGFAALVLILPSTRLAKERHEVELPESRGAASETGSAEVFEEAEDHLDVSQALRTRSFWILLFTLMSFWMLLVTVLQHFVLYLMDSGLSRGEATAHMANLVLMGAASKLVFGWVADRLTPPGAMKLDYAMLAISAGLLLLPPGPLVIWCFVVVMGFAYAARDVVTPLVIGHCFGIRYLAPLYGVLMLTFPVGGTVGPIFAGYVQDETGSYQIAFAIIAGMLLISFLMLFFLRDERAARRT
ncbi:MAG: MFS transporter [Myxococcales bacterium]|nr:MFS transporter [Myxococcales bacterium]